MSDFRLVDTGWDKEIEDAVVADHSTIKIICPFIKCSVIDRLIDMARPSMVQVITRFNLSDFADGVSDLSALRLLLDRGAEVRGVRNLHAKAYIFGDCRAIVTSANLTEAALAHNHEFGFVSDDSEVISACQLYFDGLWARAGENLTSIRLRGWEEQVERYLTTGGRSNSARGLRDEGANAGQAPAPTTPVVWADLPEQVFVKLLGRSTDRIDRSHSILEELKQGGSHWALNYAASKRPSSVRNGAQFFMGRLAQKPNETLIYGRAIGMAHKPGRDQASAEDIKLRPWKQGFPLYVRVHHAEFVAGSFANAVPLSKLDAALGAGAYVTTQQNLTKGTGNTEPRRARMQQAAVRLTRQGAALMSAWLEEAFARHGKLSQADLDALDWPDLPAITESGSTT